MAFLGHIYIFYAQCVRFNHGRVKKHKNLESVLLLAILKIKLKYGSKVSCSVKIYNFQ